jgi:hypothetical protein
MWISSARPRCCSGTSSGDDEPAPRFVPLPERVAVFDNDGTLWCEKPMPIELAFILGRFATVFADAKP